MEKRGVLVVGETPSLGRSIVDLMRTEYGVVRMVYDVSEEAPLSTLRERFSVVIAACNGYFCATARRWMRGEFPGVNLMVVGGRDPELLRMREV
ncbi:MAG: hypothetical protein WCA77_01665, partial [Thermoplasmata archaeon]